MEIEIPGRGVLKFHAVLFDLNGTLGKRGKVSKTVKEKLLKLSKKIKVVVLSADTFGTLKQEFKGTRIEVRKVRNGIEKAKIAKTYSPYIAIGNGNNDVAMLESAVLGICVLGSEGASIEALLASDVVVKDVEDALDMILEPDVLKATLRC